MYQLTGHFYVLFTSRPEQNIELNFFEHIYQCLRSRCKKNRVMNIQVNILCKIANGILRGEREFRVCFFILGSIDEMIREAQCKLDGLKKDAHVHVFMCGGGGVISFV